MHHVYVVHCADDTLYTGYTTDVERRVRIHNQGKGARYTRARLPVVLVHTESYVTKAEAMRREYALKRLTRKQKQEIINSAHNSRYANQQIPHSPIHNRWD